MQLPINYVFYETLPSCIQLWMMRIFRSKRDSAPFGMLIQFNSEDANSSNTYDGAFIRHVPDDLILRPLMFIAEGDFFSLYPTVMVAHNISPDTLIPEGVTQDDTMPVDLNYGIDGKAEEIVAFSQKNPSILHQIIVPLFEERQKAANPIRK